MREMVFAPAHMSSSCFCQPLPDSLRQRAAAGHDATGRPIAGNWWTLPEMAAGGLWTTADDLARFVITVNRSWNGGDGAVLRPTTAHDMLTAGRGGWGLGFAIDTTGHETRFFHTGSNDGYRAIIVGYPARGDGIVILTNGDGGSTIREELLRSVSAEYGWPGYDVAERHVDPFANAQLRQFVGRFQYAPRFVSTFEVLGDSLIATLNAGEPARAYPERRDEFFSLTGTTYRFVRGANNEVESVVARFVDGSKLVGRRLDR